MQRSVQSGQSMPERMEKHTRKSWYDKSFNHKTTTTMGLLTPLACKEVNAGERMNLYSELQLMFAPLLLPIMHQCYYTLDWFYVRNGALWPNDSDGGGGWEAFYLDNPENLSVDWAWTQYTRAQAVDTECIMNYFGFNAPPTSGTLILQTRVGAMPISAYVLIYDNFFRNDQIQLPRWKPLTSGENTVTLNAQLPNFLCLRRNWPRDYYTSATPAPQYGADIFIPYMSIDPETGEFKQVTVLNTDGTLPAAGSVLASGGVLKDSTTDPIVLQLSGTIRQFRYNSDLLEFLERRNRGGDKYADNVHRATGWNPDPLMINRPKWIGGTRGQVNISSVLSTAEVGEYTVGGYAGRALAQGSSPKFSFTAPDYGFVMAIFTCYPKASYYSGQERMWARTNILDYMFEEFALIGDQPLKNKEVWFSWYDADIAWNEETFGYLPQYCEWKYSNDIVSGQMRTLWESFHLGRKFVGAGEVILNDEFITCTPDIGRVFVVDAEAGEHEIYMHCYMGIEIERALPYYGIPKL